MADHGLFIGWGDPVYGREEKGLAVFNESMEYYGRLQQDGRIESFEVGLLDPHGGDLAGFVVLRGSRENLAAIRGDDEFRRLLTRASLIIQSLGVVDALFGNEVAKELDVYRAAASELA
jgi:hypothetical protein